MSKHQIAGLVRNADGSSAAFSGEISVLDPPVIRSVTVNPQSAPSGTLRTITIDASDPQGEVLTYECTVDGVPATPTSAPNVFTWVG